MKITALTLTALRDGIRQGKFSAVEATEAAFSEIAELKDLNATITVDKEKALNAAKLADESKDFSRPLSGVPILIKDNICTKGLKTTCASEFLREFTPIYDATAVKRLKNAGAIIIGKTNMDEFGMGSRGENSAFGAVKNPHDPSRCAGGSSSGSACSVASFQVPAAIGTDTGGSITLPASHCGVVGLKPTYSAVSRFGLIAYASSLDRIGPIARSVRDCAEIMQVMAGRDGLDGTCVKSGADYLDYAVGVNGLTVGIPSHFFGGVDEKVVAAVQKAARILERNGARLVEMDIPVGEKELGAYYAISCAEAASNLARFDGIKFGKRADGSSYNEICVASRTSGFGDEVKRRIVFGNHVLSGEGYSRYYIKANKVRREVTERFGGIFEKCDLILSPSAPSVAPLLDAKSSDVTEGFLEDIYNVPISLAGLPSLCVPINSNPLPIGVQLVGKAFSEPLLFGVGEMLEREVSR